MRILHVITKRQLRGAEIFASQLSDEFVKSGHEVLIVALRQAVVFPTVNGVTYIDLDLKASERWWSYAAWQKFAGIVKSWKPDVIQANASETLKFTVISRLLFRWKVPLVYRNANKVSDFIRSSISLFINTRLARSVDFVISVSENCRVDFVQTFGISPAKTTTIPIGTVLPDAKSTNDDTPPLNQPAYWINVASLVPEKNHEGLLKIYQGYRERGGTANLKIIGDGKAKISLVEQANALDIAQYVDFMGYRQDVPLLMERSCGLLLPSLIEGLPGVILEAMAVQIPVVAFSVGGIPEVVEHEVTGMLIAKGDNQAFVQCMLTLDENPVLRAKIVASAYNLCVRQFGIEPVARKFLEQYKRLLC